MARIGVTLLVIVAFLSCTDRTETTQGVVTNIDYQHIGRNKYKQVITFSYTFNQLEYSNTETNWFSGQGVYKIGDSVRVSLDKSDPESSQIIGSLRPAKPVPVIKLKSKE